MPAGKELSKSPCNLEQKRTGSSGAFAVTDSASKSRAVQLQRAQIASAMVFKAHGEEQYAREILQRLSPNNSDDPFVKSEMAKIQEEDAKNLAQKKNWGVYDKYVHNPFSRFNFDLAVAYLVQKYHLPQFFQHMGENRIDAALKISPASRDARLLKAWYLYSLRDGAKAAKDAEKLLADHPKDSNIWFALGFFRIGTGDDAGALEAFHKVLELYPGYPHRAIIENVCMKLSRGKIIKSASLTK
jgi:predicted Zn-dependent protease